MEATDKGRVEERVAMVRVVAADAVETSAWLGKAALAPEVVAAMKMVPRHRFVPEECQVLAYANRPQRIGYGQTISQPFIVALMSDMAAVRKGDRVLEIGTGCGYQSAMLAELGAEVYSVERIPQLAASARDRLDGLGYGEAIHILAGDGAKGWPEHAPYDSIVVTATTNPAVVAELLKQLAPGGRMVVPEIQEAGTGDNKGAGILGLARWLAVEPETDLCLITKDEKGVCTHMRLLPVAFVPLVEGDPAD
ncbi:protein-L-isoaspartate O-methyltransferase [Pelagibius sp. Alg239-R121]|uniref:protein-L-isoaspartate O-methyltransferase n=1 Tax=Pelagibius sp. Alg239-R121 TaxID=2993448 RepID=UPI0024A65548|nr:protein-L-isoaspartate O-methyltransferase [Pelagibius sp. Alg239-R121]